MTKAKTAHKPRLTNRQRLAARPPMAEEVDPIPIAPTVNQSKPETLQDEIRRFIRQEVSTHAELAGNESFEEADDFEEENPEHLDLSPYEFVEIQEEYIPEVTADPTQAPQEADLPAELASDHEADEPSETPAQAPQDNTENQ